MFSFEFQGARSAPSIASEAINLLKQTVEDRLSGRGGSKQQACLTEFLSI